VFPDIITKYPTDAFIPSSLVTDNAALAFEGVARSGDEAKMIGWIYIALSDLLGSLNLVSRDGDRELPARVVAYIDENFKEPLTIDYIAKVFGYHPSYIAHVFCDQLKISFRTYLGAVRAEYAAAEIRTTQKSLTEIAYESGCNSLNTFCRCFKKHFSMTPSQYKKSINNKNA
jgi:YesN/AraC family two-component response regulator